ncbi:MAG: AI-2E family transporter [Bdellovibrionales bacterium]
MNTQMGGFIRARLLEAAFVGAITWVGLWAISFPFAPILAFFAAITNLIPYVGPLVGMVPALIISFINGDGMVGMLITATPYLIAQIIDAFFIIPIVVAKIVDLHAITVILSLIIGAQLLGVLGMIIAIPVASALKVTISNVYRHILDFRLG